jgi:penicillin-binding protein 1A
LVANRQKSSPRPLRRVSLVRLVTLLALYGGFAGAGAIYHGYTVFAAELPSDLSAALDYHPDRTTRVYSADGEVIGEFFLQRRVVVPLERIPSHVQQAFISAEDGRFWTHPGFDLAGITRAAWRNFAGGGISQGASTITQQVMRMLMLRRERTYSRKIKELILAWRIEHELEKRDILHIYLNQVYLGHGSYGVEAAAEAYFGKRVDDLTVAEAAMLAGLPQSPSRYSPTVNYELARRRQRYVLDRMRIDGKLTAAEAEQAWNEPIALVDGSRSINAIAAPYFVEHVRRWATERYGHRSVFYGGLRIYTTLDGRLQRAAEAAVHDGLRALDAELGFRGQLGHLAGADLQAFVNGPPRPFVRGLDQQAISGTGVILDDVTYLAAVVDVRDGEWRPTVTVDLGPRELPLGREDARTLVRWRSAERARIAIGDLVPVALGTDDEGTEIAVLSQDPDVQAAVVSIDPATGGLLAMVGGYDFAQSKFNRAVQARRQAGSSIKPFIYAAALERGYTHLTTVLDAPIRVETAGGIWSPGNFKPEFLGPISLRTALAKSINTVSVRLVLDIGVDAVVDMMRRLGVESPIPRHISIALGTPDVSLLEMTGAVATFPAGGLRVKPRFIDLVSTDDGVTLEDHRSERPTLQVISPQVAYLMVELMKTVVARGTARGARELGRPAAGKTGTSTEHRDAWFYGFTADRVTGVWVGRDDFTPIDERVTGGATALPIWEQFMVAAHEGLPAREFPVPDDILWVRASEAGRAVPAGTPGAELVPLARGTVPPAFATAPPARFEASEPFSRAARKP